MLYFLSQVLEDSEVKEQQAKAAEQVLSMLAPPQQSVLESTGSLCSVENVFDWRPSITAASTIMALLHIDETEVLVHTLLINVMPVSLEYILFLSCGSSKLKVCLNRRKVTCT